MSTYILTSMFHNGFDEETADIFRQKITNRNKFAFVASEFEQMHEKTDKYFGFFLNMFEEVGIHFEESYVIDGRMDKGDAQKKLSEADVIWISGGDTPKEFGYLIKYGLDAIIKQHDGVIIGMSAGSINMAKTSICTVSCGHHKQEIYNGLSCVDISVEPHFDIHNVSNELIGLSYKYLIYGLCDESFIVYSDNKIEFFGEIYKLSQGNIERL